MNALTQSTFGSCGVGDNDAQAGHVVVAETLNSGGNSGGFRTEPGAHLVCFDPTTSLDQAPSLDTAPPLKQGSGVGIPWAPAVAYQAEVAPVVFDETQITSALNRSCPRGDSGHPLAAGARPPSIATPAMVRRLTPQECERLQGFPDGWTCVCGALEAVLAARGIAEPEWRAADWRVHDLADLVADHCRCPDGPRYRMMGNAVTVPVAEWLGRRLAEVL